MQIIQGTRQSIELPLAPRNLTLSRWEHGPEHMLWSINMAHIRFTLSFRAHQLQICNSIFDNLTLGSFLGALSFPIHGSWYMYKVALCIDIVHSSCPH